MGKDGAGGSSGGDSESVTIRTVLGSMREDSEAIKKHYEDAKQPGPRHVSPPFTINNKFIVEAYNSDRALKSVERNGFATIAQKVTVVGLKLLMDAQIQETKELSRLVPKGSLVYIKEEFLHTNQGVKRIYESDAVEGKFNIIEMAYVEFVVPK
jgi:hypothetical protein